VTNNAWTYGSMTFPEQLKYLRQFHDIATGVNSGGLDLASAAGLPTLRFFEMPTGVPWQHDFNSYLAVALNLGLRPGHPDEFAPAMRAFVDLILEGKGLIPLHAILETQDRVSNCSRAQIAARVWNARI
jgi:hypothetical protein